MGVPDLQIVFLNFEDFELRKFINDLDTLDAHIIGALDLTKPFYVFLDEIQNANGFERLVDGLWATSRNLWHQTLATSFHRATLPKP